MTESDLNEIASALRDKSQPVAQAIPKYDGMSNAIFWSDELDDLDVAIVWKLRPILRARTCMITGTPVEYAEELKALHRICPSWKGFCDERMRPSESLAEFFKDKEAHFMDGFHDSLG